MHALEKYSGEFMFKDVHNKHLRKWEVKINWLRSLSIGHPYINTQLYATVFLYLVGAVNIEKKTLWCNSNCFLLSLVSMSMIDACNYQCSDTWKVVWKSLQGILTWLCEVLQDPHFSIRGNDQMPKQSRFSSVKLTMAGLKWKLMYKLSLCCNCYY